MGAYYATPEELDKSSECSRDKIHHLDKKDNLVTRKASEDVDSDSDPENDFSGELCIIDMSNCTPLWPVPGVRIS